MPVTIDNTKLILVEGSSDKAFFKNLLAKRGISGFDIVCPWDMEKGLEGEDAIKQLLEALPVNKGFTRVKKILIVVDSDDDPEEKFKKFKELLSGTRDFSGSSGRYPIPDTPNSFISAPNSPDVAIMTLPDSNMKGAMETLCWNAAMPLDKKLAECIETFSACAGADTWSPQKLAKFKLRSLMSAKYNRNPDIPTTYLWDRAPEIVPLDSPAFDNLVDFLSNI